MTLSFSRPTLLHAVSRTDDDFQWNATFCFPISWLVQQGTVMSAEDVNLLSSEQTGYLIYLVGSSLYCIKEWILLAPDRRQWITLVLGERKTLKVISGCIFIRVHKHFTLCKLPLSFYLISLLCSVHCLFNIQKFITTFLLMETCFGMLCHLQTIFSNLCKYNARNYVPLLLDLEPILTKSGWFNMVLYLRSSVPFSQCWQLYNDVKTERVCKSIIP